MKEVLAAFAVTELQVKECRLYIESLNLPQHQYKGLRGSLCKNLMTSLDQKIDFSQTLYLRLPL
jgi:hypothetical protein